ncbi:Tn3 family transposase, partial [Nonomuraea sp. NPDC049028]|uniref:Tn3 family transposase n=1 Tax=Nonomuraea sp. NPDC049028 TaxID=3364348 RepID=UPI00371659A2
PSDLLEPWCGASRSPGSEGAGVPAMGPGYPTVDRKSVCVYSQLRSCNASEVAAMMEGVLRHCTDATIDRQYTDSHGQSLVGFAFSYLLGFKLLPRMKNIARQKLVKADADDEVPSCLTGMVADKPIDWEIIAQQYDQMAKYATALRSLVPWNA